MTDYNGVIKELVEGSWVEPETGKQFEMGINDIVISDSLDGGEAELVAKQHTGQTLTVVSDPNTHAALGERVFKALKAGGFDVREYIWQDPKCTDKGVEHIRQATRHTDALIAVGAGTVSDTVKYACYLDKRNYSVFATSPMCAFATPTASVSFDGFKRSITCSGAQGAYFDLSVIAKCPKRLISAAFADVICRTTSQVDWLTSHLFLGTPYMQTPYTVLAYDEENMIARAGDMLNGDIDALGMLTRTSTCQGLGTRFTSTTHSGSMAEHMISHYIDMFAGDRHPQTSHGEQVGVATITMSQLHNQMLAQESPPVMKPTDIPVDKMRNLFPAATADNMIEQTKLKAIDRKQAAQLNKR
ncbi:MAG: iron-containing alcohol dehydrogenase, partial [Granulosicoccus sp.]